MDETLGPVAVSLRREKLEDDKEHSQQYNYRLIFRTSEVRHRLCLLMFLYMFDLSTSLLVQWPIFSLFICAIHNSL